MNRLEPGLYLAHKPVGVTSFSVVQACFPLAERGGRRLPLCHGGTLDPFAHGLLLLLVGQATKLMDFHHAAPKTYVAQVEWGVETDNGDLHGKAVFSGDPAALDPKRLNEALAPFLGWQDQVPPTTSAKKIGGEPAYRKVHRGETVVMPASKVFLHQARWLSHYLPKSSQLELTCRGGYYVRALARDLGQALGCGAHLSALHRSAIGPWQDPGPGPKEQGLLPFLVRRHGAELLPWCESRRLDDQELGALRQGQGIVLGRIEAPSYVLPEGFADPQAPVRGLHQGRLVALLQRHSAQLVPLLDLHKGL